MINKILVIFGGIIILKVFYNTYYFLLARKFLKKYEEYLTKREDWYITENR